MAGLIPKDIVERIKNESDIVAVISEFVNLKKSGKDYKGLCPFHQEKTPSFFVISGKGFYHCFGCSKGGNVINFIMEHERFDYPGALRYLAAKSGIMIPETGNSKSDSDRLHNALSLAAGYFESSLWSKSAETAIKYLESRGIGKSTAKMFGIGFAPPGWDGLINAVSSKGIKASDLERAGLAIKKEGYYDRFRNRLMIPIRTIAGRVIGFGGRVLPGDDSPKYINSPETEMYKKGRILYGLDVSKDETRVKNEAVVVEGYFDLITMYQSGIKNVVAASGTGFTAEQAALLARFCERVVLLYDSDSAGVKAAFRACGILYNAGLEPRMVRLPKGFDPDSFVRENGAEKLSGLIKEANDILDFVQQFIKGRFADQPLSKQKKIINKLTELMEPIEDDLTRDLLSKKMFEKINIDSKTLGILSERRTTAQPGSDVSLSPTRDRVEREFLAILLTHPEQISKAEEVVEESLFTEESNARIFAAITKFHTEGKDLDISELSEEVGGNGAGSRLREIALQEQSTAGRELVFEEYLKKFRLITARKRLNELKGMIGEAERISDQNRIEILTREFQNLKLEVEANDARV